MRKSPYIKCNPLDAIRAVQARLMEMEGTINLPYLDSRVRRNIRRQIKRLEKLEDELL